jgi:type I restriction enzyme, S subunit
MSQVIPEGWVDINLGEIIELKYGKSLPAKTRDGVGAPVYGSNGVVGKHSIPLVSTPGIVVGRKGSFGEVTLASEPFSPIDTTYFVDEFYGQPLMYWLYQLKNLPLTSLNRSTAIPGLNREDAYEQVISLPPLAEQKVIAEKLDELLAQVESSKARLNAIPAILKSFRQSILAAAVSGKLVPSVGSRVTTVGQVAQDIRYGTSKKCDYNGGVTPVIRIPNIGNRKLDVSDLKSANFSDKELDKLVLQEGDLLVIRSNGSVELVAKPALVEKQYAGFLFAGYLIRIRCNQEQVLPSFLLNVLCSRVVRDAVEIGARSTSGVNNINSKELASLEFVLPSLKAQTEIVRRVEELFAFADKIEVQVNAAQARVNNLTQSILAKAFKGELTANWRAANPDLMSGDDSAKALLVRIKAERESLQPKCKVRKKK